jgi:hypothetical protein
LSSADSDALVNETLCSTARTSSTKMMAGTGCMAITTSGGGFGMQQTAGGIALSGGWIYNALDA